jgi:hypothetical protein
MLVIAAFAAPSLLTTIGNIRVRSSADSVAGLLQNARARAAKDNRFYSVIPDSSVSTAVRKACIDLNWNGSCDSGELDVQMARSVNLVSSGYPSTTVITCGALGPATCPSGYIGLNYTPQAMTVKPSFNARALPCVNNPPGTQPVWPAVLCYTTDQNQPSHPAVGFLYVFQYNGILRPSYAAVSVTPAGRVSSWTYGGQDSNGQDVWNP